VITVKKIHPGHHLSMILQKSLPKLSRSVAAMQPRKVSRDRSLGSLESEFQQLAMDAWGAPGRVLARHSPKGSANLAQGDRSVDYSGIESASTDGKLSDAIE
jgi:hypothetical protein